MGTGSATNTAALNGAVYALLNDGSGNIYAGGAFTRVGPRGAPHLGAWISGDKTWLGSGSLPTGWSDKTLNGDIHALAWDGVHHRLFVGGTFTDAGGDARADFLAIWDNGFKPFCDPAPAFGGSVSSLQIIGSTLYVGGAFQNGAHINTANYLIACDLNTGAARAVGAPGDLNGGVYALTADANGTLYAGGQFIDAAGIRTADHIAAFDGTSWRALGAGVTDYVRSLASSGNDVYIGTDAINIAGIEKADHVAKWDGSAWSAVGANSAGTDGWLPKTAFIYAMAATSTRLVVTGSFQNADGNPAADTIASFDGTKWTALGSDGAGNGPLPGNGLAVAILGDDVYAGGNFTTAGGDSLASYVARYTTPTPPSNVFTFGGYTRNLATGTATLIVHTPGPGKLTLRGRGVKPQSVTTPAGTATVKLTVSAVGNVRGTLLRRGHVVLTLTVTFTPTGGTSRTRSRSVELEKRR
jgi:hypothetical protein